jgi:hypothetical protein
VLTEIDKFEIRHRALLEVIRFFGGVADCAKALGVSRGRLSNWLNKWYLNIPYEYVLLMEYLTQVSIERLSPFTEKINKAIRRQQNKEKVFEQSIEKITVEQPIPCSCCQQSHAILVGTDGVLIRCLSQLEAYKKVGKKRIPVTIIDVGSLLLGVRTIEGIPVQFSTSDRVAIGLRLEQLIGNRQGQRTDLNKNAKIHENSSELRRNCDEVIEAGRTDKNVATMVNFNSRDTYRRAKRVCLQGIPELIHAMDCKKISVTHATQIAKRSKAQQQVHLQSLLFSEKQDV